MGRREFPLYGMQGIGDLGFSMPDLLPDFFGFIRHRYLSCDFAHLAVSLMVSADFSGFTFRCSSSFAPFRTRSAPMMMNRIATSSADSQGGRYTATPSTIAAISVRKPV